MQLIIIHQPEFCQHHFREVTTGFTLSQSLPAAAKSNVNMLMTVNKKHCKLNARDLWPAGSTSNSRRSVSLDTA